MANIKISELPALVEQIDKENDALAIVDIGPHITKKITPDNLILPYAANEADIISGTRDDLFITPRSLADTDLFFVRFFICTFNADEQLKTEDKAFQDIPIELNEFHLVSWTAMCYSPSTTGDIIFSIKFNDVSMFTSQITIDEGHYSSTTSAHQAVIDIPNSEITTGGILSAEITNAGVGATYVKVTLGFRKRIGSGEGESGGGGEGHATAFADVTGPEGAGNENIPIFDGTSGKLLKDSNVNINDIISGGLGNVIGPNSSVNNNVVLFDGITGKHIKDSGLVLSGTNTGDQVSSDFTHNDLQGLQRSIDSTSSDYYHLTTDQLIQIELNDHNTLNGIQGGEIDQYYHLTYDEREQALAEITPATTVDLGSVIIGNGLEITPEGILSTGNHNDLQNIQGGDSTANDVYHLTSAEHTIVQNTSGINTGNETTTTIGNLVHNASEKSSLLLADELLVTDSSSSYIGKKISFENLAIQIGLSVTGYTFRGAWVQNVNGYQYPPTQSGTYVKTTNYESGTSYYPYFSTDPLKLLIGLSESNSWRTDTGITSNQRFHIDLGETKIITSLYYENFHRVGALVNQGARAFTLWGSNSSDSFNDLTYEHDENWSQLTTDVSEFDIHSGVNSPDPKYVNITNTTAYRYYAIKFSSNWNGTSIGLRRLELYGTSSTYLVNDIAYVDNGLYKCIVNHISAADNKPGYGANWETYWVLIYEAFHNLATDLQGGEIDEYYHLTSLQRQKALAEMYPGVYTIPTITDNGDGTITVGNDGVYHLFTESDGSGDILSFSISGGTFAPTLDVPNYLVADYNNGIPEIRCLSSYVTINGSTIVPIMTLYIWSSEPTNISQLSWESPSKMMASKLTERFLRAGGITREYGVVLGELPDRIITVTEGSVWFGCNRITMPSFNSTTDLLREWTWDGTWDATAVVQYDTLHFQGAYGKTELGDGKFGVIWVYRKMVTSDPVGVVAGYVFGTQEYDSLKDALESQPPTDIPAPIYQIGVLVGRITFEKGATSATEIDSAFEYIFSGSGVSNHNELANIDGGGSGGYYHLTGPEYIVAQNTSGINTGDQNDHNLMDDLQGGDSTSSQYYHITQEIYNNLLATKGLGGAKYANIITISPTEDEIEGEKYQTILGAQAYLATLIPAPSAINIWGILISGTNSENIDVGTIPYVHYLGIKNTTRLTGQITSTGLNLQSATDQRFWVKDCVIDNLILGNLCGCQFEGCRITGGNVVAGSIGIFDNCMYEGGTFPYAAAVGLNATPVFFNSVISGGTLNGGAFINTPINSISSLNITGFFIYMLNQLVCQNLTVANGGVLIFLNAVPTITGSFIVQSGGTLQTGNTTFISFSPTINSGGTWTKLDRHNVDHGDLQGGTTGQYYHLTTVEHTVVQNTSGVNTGDQTSSDFIHNELTGLQGGDSTSNDYYHLNEYEYNQVQANDHNVLNNIQGGKYEPGISPNLINDNCTSPDGWAVDNSHGTIEISGGGIYFEGYELGCSISKTITYTNPEVTLELRTSFSFLGIHGGVWTGLHVLFASGLNYFVWLNFNSDGIWYLNSSGVLTKICDVDYTDTIWRMEFSDTTGILLFYKDGILQDSVNDVSANGFGITYFSIAFRNQCVGYLLPNIKFGDGLGNFGTPEQYYHAPAPMFENDFIIANDTPSWDVKGLEETKDILGIITVHNNLENLQGGDSTSNDFYHLTEQEYDHVYNGEVIVKSSRGGGLIRKSSIESVTLSDSTAIIDINIPATSRIVGIQLIVDELITSGDGATSWSASLYGGSFEQICSEIPFTKDTTIDSFVTSIVLSETDIEIIPDTGTFSGGVITAVCYYEMFEDLTTV